jgi:flavorubredoxin
LSASVTTIVDGKLYALTNPFALNGRLSTHGDDATGFAPLNSYVLINGDHAMLIDTGWPAHRAAVLDQLGLLIGSTTQLIVYPLRIGEYNSIGNVDAISRHFNVVKFYSAVPHGLRWLTDTQSHIHNDIPQQSVKDGAVIRIGPGDERLVDVLPAPLRLLPTNWLYDRVTRTLFTSDAFSHVSRSTAEGPWVINEIGDDDMATTDIRAYLRDGRFWWVEEAETSSIQEAIGATFRKSGVDVIAPAFGCILAGHDIVRRHRQMMDDILASSSSATVM